MKVVGDNVGIRPAIDRNGRGEDDARCVAGLSERIEQRTGAVEIDAVAEFEIGLRFARNDTGEMEHQIWPWGDERGRRTFGGEITDMHGHMHRR